MLLTLLAAVCIGQAPNPYPSPETLPYAPPYVEVETRSVRYCNEHTGGKMVYVQELGYWKKDGFSRDWVRVRPGKPPVSTPETHKRGDYVSISSPEPGVYFRLAADPAIIERLRQPGATVADFVNLKKARQYEEVDNKALGLVLERKQAYSRVRLKDGREGWVHYDEVTVDPSRKPLALPPEANAEIIKAMKAARARAGVEPLNVRRQVLKRETAKRLRPIATKYKVTVDQLAEYVETLGKDR